MLRLEVVHRYDAQGSHFDRNILTQRLYGALDAWMARARPADCQLEVLARLVECPPPGGNVV
eukprot:343393-Lingulodinium_polyedra.AAC.1